MRALLPALLALVAACGTLGGDDGGGANLPSSEIRPYTKIEGDAVLSEPGVDLRQPWVVSAPDDSMRLWMAVRDVGAGVPSAIRAWSSSDGLSWEALEPALEATDNGELGAPCVVLRDGTWHLWFTEGGAIHHATSADGTSWERDPDPALVAEVDWELAGSGSLDSPSALYEGARWRLWYTGGDGSGVGLAESTDGTTWSRMAESAVFTPSSDEEGAGFWDRDALLSVHVARETTSTGRSHYRMWYTGARIASSGELDTAVGFAGSFDGFSWSRAGSEPVLREGSLAEKEPFGGRLPDGQRALWFTQYWKKDGSNRHVLFVATFGLEPLGP